MKRQDLERYVIHDDVLKCCRCKDDDGRAQPVDMVAVATDLFDAIGLHNWKHEVSEKRGIPVGDFQ